MSWNSGYLEQSCSMRTDGQTDLTKLIVFLQAAKKQYRDNQYTTVS